MLIYFGIVTGISGEDISGDQTIYQNINYTYRLHNKHLYNKST